MWKQIGERFLELYELHESEEHINLASFSMLDEWQNAVKSFQAHINYEGVKALSKIRPKVMDNNLYLEVKIFVDAAVIRNKHYVSELVHVEENSKNEMLYSEVLAFNKENFINFLLEQKEFGKLKQYIEMVL